VTAAVAVAGEDMPLVEYVRLSEIKRAKRNPKKHDIPGIASSIREHGFAEVLIENARTGRLVAGHGRLEALEHLVAEDAERPPKYIRRDPKTGEWMAPVLRGVAFKNEQEAEGYLLADNRWVEIGGWSQADLAPVLQRLHEASGPAGLARVGWDEDAFARLRAASSGGSSDTTLAPGAAGEGVIRQIVFPFKDAAMGKILARLARVMQLGKVDNHSAALVLLLETYEKKKD